MQPKKRGAIPVGEIGRLEKKEGRSHLTYLV